MRIIEVIGDRDVARLARIAESPDPAHRYLAAMVKNGPAIYIENAKVKIYALVVDDKILPLVVSERIPGNSNICSAYAHYFEYAVHEFAKRYSRIPSHPANFVAPLVARLLRDRSIDQIVFVNNWLLSTNPNHALSDEQIRALTSYLTQRHPASAIVFRSINPMTDPRGYFVLAANRYRMVPSRRVFMLDARRTDFLKHGNVRRDFHRLAQTQYSLVDTPNDLNPHAARIAALNVSISDKHSHLNPRITADFVAMTMETRFLEYSALLEDDQVQAVVNYYIRDGLMVAVSVGYNQQLPSKLGLYRLAFALLMEKASRDCALMNLSAGAGEFKMFRGAVPIQEYDAVYDHHLPLNRRLQWQSILMAARVGSLFARRH